MPQMYIFFKGKNNNPEQEEEQLSQTVKIPRMPPVPATYGQIRSRIVDGAKAMIPMLPRVEIKYEGKHAYVLPSECLRHFLAFGNEVMEFDITCRKKTICCARIHPEVFLLHNT